MPLTPSDVRDTSFRVVLRGYAVEEVDAFLDRVEEELSRRPDSADEAAPPAGGHSAGHSSASGTTPAPDPDLPADSDVAPTGGFGRALRVLLLAEQTAERTLAQARDEAEELRSSAEAAAARTQREAQEGATSLLSAARAEADEALTAVRAEVLRAEVELQQRSEREIADLQRRCQELRSEVEGLEQLERRWRDRMTTLLQEHLRLLEHPGVLRAVPPSAAS